MNSFFESQLCKSGEACRKCRRSRLYRKGIVASFDEPTDFNFECPLGKTVNDFRQDIEPDIFKMGANLVSSLTKEVKARATGQAKTVSENERSKRLEICAGCEFYTDAGRCAKCGCFMKFKSRLRTGSCPIGRW